jgi:uncharacterized protein (TIGR00369 family)
LDVSSTDMCFACGKKNACGLKMNFEVEEGRAISHFHLDERFQGWRGIAHGGIVATVLDEAMAWAVMSLKIQAVTSELNVKYKKPTPLKEELTVNAEVVEKRGKIVKVHAEILDKSKEILAISSGTYFKVGSLK